MRIGIYGGSFNPPHRGHVLAAQQCRELLRLDRLILIPDALPPHKELPEGSPDASTRLRMVELAAEEIPGAQVSDMALRRTGKSYTVDTLRQLRQEHPQDDLFFLMGTDMFLSFDHWRLPEEIAKLAHVVCMLRTAPSQELLAALEAKKAQYEKDFGASVVFAENDALDVSSTQVRRMLFFGCGDLYLPKSVAEEIKKTGLYSTGRAWTGLDFETLKEKALSLHKSGRVNHAIGCCESAVELAKRFGADPVAAARAGILHDVTKALTGEEQLHFCACHQIPVNETERLSPGLLHAKTAAWAAEHIFGESPEVCQAIRWHTTGKADMTDLQKIVYIADYIEPNRIYPGVETIREAVEEGLDAAMVAGLSDALAFVRKRGKPVCDESVQALAFLQGR